MSRPGLSDLLAAASASAPSSPSPSASASAPTGVADLQNLTSHPGQTAGQAASWLDTHWQGWVVGLVQILFILLLALVLRAMVRKMIDQLIGRMSKGSDESVNVRLGGLLVNAERRQQRSAAIGSVLRSVASFLIMGTAALTALSVLNINLAPLLASAGVAGVAIGFGARNLVTDFISGVFMILEDQYGVGDEIDMGVASGTVLEVGLRVTKLRGDGGEIWYIRNGEVKRIANHSQGWATASVDVQVGYEEDVPAVRALIETTAEEMAKESPWDEALWEPVQVLGLVSVTADVLVFQVQAKTMPGKAASVARELRARIKAAFDEAGISVGRDRIESVGPLHLLPAQAAPETVPPLRDARPARSLRKE
jgi:small-conductance mechanosensitive channel